MNALKFIKTMTVEQFKAAQKVETISVRAKARKNPDGSIMKDPNGKTVFYSPVEVQANPALSFFTFGAGTGAVSSKGFGSKPVISLVEGDNGEFYLLHEEAQGAPEITSF